MSNMRYQMRSACTRAYTHTRFMCVNRPTTPAQNMFAMFRSPQLIKSYNKLPLPHDHVYLFGGGGTGELIDDIYFTNITQPVSPFFSFVNYRSANYYPATGVCELSEMDRITLAGSSSFQMADGKWIACDQPRDTRHASAGGVEQSTAAVTLELGCVGMRVLRSILNTKQIVWSGVGDQSSCANLLKYCQSKGH